MNFHRQAPDENVNLTSKSVSDTDGGSWDLQSLLSGESFSLAHGIDDDALGAGAALPPEPAGPSDEDAASRAPAYTPEMNRQLERWLQTLCDEPRLGQWEHFRLEEKLGDGGFGVVYRAQDMRGDRTVALKVLRLKHTSDYSEGKKRFENEARGVLALRHPHVIRGFEAGVIAGRPYLSMELARCSLHDLLAQRGQLPWREAVELILQAARGLAELHDQSFIHRDLKPGNLLLMQDGRLKIADLGLVTAPQNEDSALAGPPTTMGRTVGTTDYMSPEQCLGSRVGVAADIYSLGMVLFRMIAGRRPDQGLRPRQRLFHRAWRAAAVFGRQRYSGCVGKDRRSDAGSVSRGSLRESPIANRRPDIAARG